MTVIYPAGPRTPNDPEFTFHCPACRCPHWFKTAGEGSRWQWNGDFIRPTITPSIVVRADGQVCHFFIRDGRFEYCPDSTHALAGQSVPMEEDP